MEARAKGLLVAGASLCVVALVVMVALVLDRVYRIDRHCGPTATERASSNVEAAAARTGSSVTEPTSSSDSVDWEAQLSEWRALLEKNGWQPSPVEPQTINNTFDAVKMLPVLQRVTQTFQVHRIVYYVAFGTLLGFVRDRTFLPGEHNANLSIHVSNYSYVRDVVVPALARHGITLREMVPARACRFLFEETGDSPFEAKQFVFVGDGQTVKVHLQVWMPPVERVEVLDHAFHFPVQAELYLQDVYGTDWRTPNPRFYSVVQTWTDPHERRLATAVPWRGGLYFQAVTREEADPVETTPVPDNNNDEEDEPAATADMPALVGSELVPALTASAFAGESSL